MSLLLATTLLLTQAGATATDPAAAPPADPDLAALGDCADSLDVSIFNTPRLPDTRDLLRVLVVSEPDLGPGRVLARDPAGAQRELPAVVRGGPPWGWVAEVDRPAKGTWRFALVTQGRVTACQDVEVRPRAAGGRAVTPGDPAWTSRIKWERDTENLYSLWVEHLFDAPVDADVSWNPLHLVLRDRSRNLLFDHLKIGEDSGRDAPRLAPDCADFPYVLRGYFAWKLGLPFGYRPCTRGNPERAPTCGDPVGNDEPTEATTRLAAFKAFIHKVQGTIHSSSLRGLPEDEDSDLYPVALDRRGLRPGAVYADPYGHTMMVGRWFPQTADSAGVLMAIDAQPDGVVGRRLFWRGSFQFPKDDALAGAGWKRFRPVRATSAGVTELSNRAIAALPDYGDFSLAQWSRGQEGFYEQMDEVINPRPMAPDRALFATIDALEQQLRRRVESIENAEVWARAHPGTVVPVPKGAAIFITSGPWEDYSTPSRDMRLLIAIDTVRAFPRRVLRRPDRFILAAGESPEAARARLEALLAEETARRSIRYPRSDGSLFTLTLAEVLARAEALEMGYNPNDCAELRWGAPDGSDEGATCARRAPEAQRATMEAVFRPWFRERARPIE